MMRSKTTGPRQGARRALFLLGAVLALLAAPALSVQGTGDLKPFVGTWTGNWNPGPGSNGKLRALDLEIRPGGSIVETWYRYRKNDDGTTRTEKSVRPVTSYAVSGQTLTLKSRVEKFQVQGRAPVAAEIEESLELKGRDEAVFKSLSNSYLVEAKRRGDFVPPPPPPIAMKRRS
ncbi:MAG TPA: hypothetical protein VIA62_04655 [Thermoanaerobaculia bacterium]|jgi:hypothetical protein|nr:hypothetical protein [Thermoanaerobaculia bacterium]